ncbi:MAG: hypothetical protein O2950_10415 [Proteobacteria bacterium]|nr:hypothetical protein [Pseudomonadota bacterium]MDA1352679.1 hypothetical protein [Pseudomonadota bacterium]
MDGHKIITQIAKNHLTDITTKAIAELTGGADLIDIALWPDRIRYVPGYKESAQWHYVNIADDESLDKIEHLPGGDILTAIRRFHGQLTESGGAKIKKNRRTPLLYPFCSRPPSATACWPASRQRR